MKTDNNTKINYIIYRTVVNDLINFDTPILSVCQPSLIALTWGLYDFDGNLINGQTRYIKQTRSIKLKKSITRQHKIYKKDVVNSKTTLETVISEFEHDFKKSHLQIIYNEKLFNEDENYEHAHKLNGTSIDSILVDCECLISKNDMVLPFTTLSNIPHMDLAIVTKIMYNIIRNKQNKNGLIPIENEPPKLPNILKTYKTITNKKCNYNNINNLTNYLSELVQCWFKFSVNLNQNIQENIKYMPWLSKLTQHEVQTDPNKKKNIFKR